MGQWFTMTEKLECVQRELKQREHVYPKRVADGKMSQEFANRQLALMKAIVEDYENLSERSRLI